MSADASAWTDEPGTGIADDRFGRGAYAQKAAELIASVHSFDSSAVVGLSGAWGSGKTTLVNMVVEALQGAHPDWVVVRFSPWATSDVTGLLSEFYSSLVRALPKHRTRHLKKAMAVAASVAAPAATLIPYGGGSAAVAINALGKAMTEAPSWQSAFSSASARLKELGIPILIVVDDIDRLHADELVALLRVVRLLGRFDGVEYLLAYDDETVFRTLASTHAVDADDGTAERFMEKIVQYPLLVPPLLREQQLTRLNAGLAEVSRGDPDEDGRLSPMLDAFAALLRTPRAIDRYVAQLRHHLPLVPPDEIDDSDVLLLTLIRVSFPALFNALPIHRDALINGHTGNVRFDRPNLEYEKFNPVSLLELAPVRHRDLAEELLYALFPKLRDEESFTALSAYSTGQRGVANEAYFDRYFAMTIPDHDLSDATVRAAVASAATGDGARLQHLLVSGDEQRTMLVLSKGKLTDAQPKTDAMRKTLVHTLAATAALFPGDDTTPFSAQDQVLSWIADLLASLDKATPADAVMAALDGLTNSSMQIRVWRSVEHTMLRVPTSEVPGWFATVADTLASRAVEQVIEHLKLGDDAPTESRFGYLLQFALRQGRTQEVRERIEALITAGDSNRPVLASRMVSAVSSGGPWRLSDEFNQEMYDLIAPEGDDPMYTAQAVEIDPSDLSWANRRRFAMGRAKRPPPSRLTRDPSARTER